MRRSDVVKTGATPTIGVPEPCYLIQPNHVTFAKRDYDLYQEKIYTEMIRQLQDALILSFNHQAYKQLEMFQDDKVVLDIPLSAISTPSQYPKVRQSLKKMAVQPIVLDYIDPQTNQPRERVGGLFIADFPKTSSYRGKAKIIMDRMVANAILTFKINVNGQSVHYTRYLYNVVMNAKSAHHINLYRLISSWKKKGFFTITYPELLAYLGIPENQYKKFYDFQRRVLIPAQNYLKECGSDCWFDCEHENFIVYDQDDKRKIAYLNFRVISKKVAKLDMNKVTAAKQLLHDHFGFNDNDFLEIEEVFSPYNFVFERFTLKANDVWKMVNEGRVTNKKEYIKTALKNEFLRE